MWESPFPGKKPRNLDGERRHGRPDPPFRDPPLARRPRRDRRRPALGRRPGPRGRRRSPGRVSLASERSGTRRLPGGALARRRAALDRADRLGSRPLGRTGFDPGLRAGPLPVCAGWARAILDARAEGQRLIAGPVVLADGSGWAARASYLCDYAMVGPGGGAAACNLAVACEILPASVGGLHKTALLESGHPVSWSPAMVAITRVIEPAWDTCRWRFRRARHHAARRAARWRPSLRFVAGPACVALPGLLYGRMVGEGRDWRSLTLGSPLVAAFLSAWALGEWAGYWSGAGKSARHL